MAADVWQHRVNSRDWDDGWFWTDRRLNLLHIPDDVFLQFLRGMVHPIVRGDAGERDAFLELFNRHLAPEGWEVGEVNRVGDHRSGRRKNSSKLCRTILKERGIDLPKDDDLPALVKLTVKSLPVVPDGIEDKGKWEGTVVRLVNNLSSAGQSLDELRNAFGTGHGKDAAHKGLDRHHARLIVHVASTVGVFLHEAHDRNPVS